MQKSYKSLAKNALFNVIYKLLNVFFPVVSVAYISRVLEPMGVGRVAYAQNIVSYFTMLAVLGIPMYGIREIAKYRDTPIAVNKLVSELLLINAITTALSLVAFSVMLFLCGPANVLIYLICGTEIFFNFINIDWLYEGEEEYEYITYRSIIIKVISLCLIFLFVKEYADYPLYALIHSLGICGNHLFNICNARKKVKLTLHGLSIKRHIKPILILACSMLLGGIYNRLNVTILGWLQSESVVGFYTNSYKLVALGMTLVTAVSAVYMPRMSYTFDCRRDEFAELVSMGAKIILLLAIPACVGMIIVAKNLVVVVFGEQFLPATFSVQIMSAIVLIVGLGDLLCYQVIICAGKEKVLIKSRVVASVVNIVLNILLIPRFQHVGASIATIVCELIVNLMLIRHSLTLVKPIISRSFFGSVLTATIVMGLVVYALQQKIESLTVSLFAAVIVGVIIYFAVVVLTKNEVVFSVLHILKNNEKQS